ncbi:MAG: purine-nucleoside phosphorylase [Candidatus Magasanikbacteria bacterium]
MEEQMTEKQKLLEAMEFVKKAMGGFIPFISITLGSGLGYMVELLEGACSCDYSDIPNCPTPGATGHAGKLWWGKLDGVPVIMLQGRVHLYEGYSVHEVVFLTRLMIMLGVKKLIMTHATGAVTRNLEPGDIVAVRSMLPLNCPDPTSGPGIPELGIEFSPVDTALSLRFRQLAKQCAREEGVSLHWGVSCFKFGRTYEGAAEGDMMARMGGDLATMSTIPDVMAAAQMNAEVLDLALITDMVCQREIEMSYF